MKTACVFAKKKKVCYNGRIETRFDDLARYDRKMILKTWRDEMNIYPSVVENIAHNAAADPDKLALADNSSGAGYGCWQTLSKLKGPARETASS